MTTEQQAAARARLQQLDDNETDEQLVLTDLGKEIVTRVEQLGPARRALALTRAEKARLIARLGDLDD